MHFGLKVARENFDIDVTLYSDAHDFDRFIGGVTHMTVLAQNRWTRNDTDYLTAQSRPAESLDLVNQKDETVLRGPWPLKDDDQGAVFEHTSCGCEKCSKRLYQDGSADAGVSFKAPTHIDPSMSHRTVASHEREHVKRESYQAQEGEAKVVSAQVRLFQRSCSECGTIYCSGGVSIVKLRPDVPMYKLLGLNVDAKA